MYLVANWFNLADAACEDALYDIPTFRDFDAKIRASDIIALRFENSVSTVSKTQCRK